MNRTLIACCALVACTKPHRETEAGSAAQPLWSVTATQPSVPRAGLKALVLANGTVVVTGGGTALTELFDPATESWTAGPSLAQAQTGNLLEQWNGKAVSIAGSDAEQLNAGAWAALPPPTTPRTGACGVTLADGRLVVIGGQSGPQTQVERLELGATWSTLASTTAPHFGHTATLLPSGNLAVVGGPTSTAELFNGATWSQRVGPERNQHTASLLPGGELLLVGGRSLLDGGIAGAERYDPVTGARTPVSGLRVPRLSHAAVSLPGGDVLVTGGEGPAAARSAERYLLALDRFVTAGCLETPRAQHAGAALNDGGVLLVGGLGLDGGPLARSEKLDLSTGLFAQGSVCAFDCECATGFCVSGICCDSACNSGPCQACGTGACQLATPAVVCRSSAGGCDLDERCTGNDAGCPPNVLAGAGATCRAAQGACDIADQCDGLSAQCPDLVAGAGASCRGAGGACDVAETCDGVSGQCPVDRLADAGTVCRNPLGACDRPEVCSGASLNCPADTLFDAGTVCRAAGSGGCDVAEVCDGAAVACPADRVADAGVVCRPVDAGCDLAESCNGVSATCPTDTVAAPGTPCRAVAGPCDVAEVCLGARACPPDGVRDAGFSCRASTGVCDAPDVCNGINTSCIDTFAPPTTPCRVAQGVCDVAERCTGGSAACPADRRVDAGVECRASAAPCDSAEACDGANVACPPDVLAGAGTLCRAAAGVCDAAEVCDGTTDACPTDAFDATTVCRQAATPCDAPETCSGAGIDCPPDRVAAAGTLCRKSAGSCDVAETCTGDAGGCPADGFAASTNVCRPAKECDPEETCSGAAADCPPDVVEQCNEQPKHYVGWNCASAEGVWPALVLLVLSVGRRRRLSVHPERSGREAGAQSKGAGSACTGALRMRPAASAQRVRGVVLAVCLFSTAARADAPILTDFSIRVNASLLRDLLASQVGAELGANVSLTRRFDIGATVSMGRTFGGRAGITWHMRDDGEWVRPFVQARALVHPVPEGIAGGAGAWAGVFVPVGPGRIQGGVLFEAYLGPAGYLPYDAFVTIGYELDIYRKIEREGVLPAPDFGGTEVPPLKKDDAQPPVVEEPAKPPAQVETTPPGDDRTTVVTRVSITKDFIFYEERKVGWMPKSEPTVRKLIEVLKRYPQLQRVEIGGHADELDSDDECVKLSMRRAEKVLQALLQAGIDPSRLTARGWGKAKNRVPATGPARKRELNRRVDFTVLQEAW